MAKRKEVPKSKAFIAASKMPPLKHSIAGEPFDFSKSEVLAWLSSQPAIAIAAFEYFRQAGAIVFRNGHWMGSNYK